MKLLTIPQVAEQLQITRFRAYELARAGMIPIVRLGRQIRVDPVKLEAWIAGGGQAQRP